MFTHAVFSLALFASPSPTYRPPPLTVVDEYTTQDGQRTRWASVTYGLPDGQTAEFILVADDSNSGDGYLYVNGEALVHATWDDANGVSSWTSSVPGAGALAGAALTALEGEAGTALLDAFTGDSQVFKCSAWGKKVLRAGKYIWGAAVMGSAAACCVETGMVGCGLCGAAGWALAEAGSEALENYCD
ncbi:hypothetical protein [Enhygromyxa salina]|uniref:Uncharacterized protein n=1 Tax=Enhygromyxa salina TaxID=215803 RepID=A0A2S9YY82_9BACT|nr:hypothetical protein [Enhygromyxa salina]PRQ10055.1 hypothetical protein ENSA7_02610 [Enhygromyxa salina]